MCLRRRSISLVLRNILPVQIVLLAVLPVLALGQSSGSDSRNSGAADKLMEVLKVTVQVSVREASGVPVRGGAIVNMNAEFGSLRLTAATQDASNATFSNVAAGDYQIEVSAPGYKSATEHASVYGGGAFFTVYVYLQPEGEPSSNSSPPGSSVMSPRLQSEIDKGLDKLRHRQFDAARAHFEKALKMAPGNPDIQYLFGLLEYTQDHLDAARTRFEAALSANPNHERSLLALGQLQLRAGDAAAAAQSFEKAYAINGADWHSHLLLASAYFDLKNYEKARPHAERAVELGKDRAAYAQVLLGRILVRQGKQTEAKQTFETVIRDFPSDPSVQEAKSQLAELNKPVAVAVSPVSQPSASTPAPLPAPAILPAAPLPATPLPAPVVRPWAPPDIDSMEYPAVEDVACSETQLIQRTQARTRRQLGNFEKFLATEHIEHQEVDSSGIPGPVKARDFNYLVLIQHPKPGLSFLEERRDGGEGLELFPTSLATRGLFSIGVSIFDPTYEGDFVYKCEGLGTWRGKAAWRIRFEQRKEVPSRIRVWRNNHGRFVMPLKGRVWIAASSYDILHLETDLREPIPALQLSREHLLIDYGPVKFSHGDTSLWLPWYAEMFMELRGKRYHHRHTLTDYMLFSVDTQNSISKPKDAAPSEHSQDP